ncbi:MAG: bifunctional diguanylate cyclase/phosphodiesterase, partial [Acidiferrobacteraceae bacterium]
ETSTGRDAVTGLMTRAEFVAAAATAAPGDSSLVYFNVRDLRTINRSSGTDAGDEALRRIARILEAPDHPLAARVGGGEFAVLVKAKAAGKLLDAVRAGAGVPIDGKVLAREADESPDGWLARAELRAPSGAARTEAPVAAAGTVDPENVVILYHPIIPLHGPAMEQYEVVLKSGDSIIEDASRIPAATDHKVLAALAKILSGPAKSGGEARFFVRCGTEFMADAEAVGRLRQTLGGDPARIVFEIPESVFSRFPEAAAAFMRALRRQEFRVAIDAFGTTTGNTKLLSQQGVDFIRLDAGLVRNVTPDSVAYMVLSHVVALAKKMNKQTIATGIEGADALSFLWQSEIDYVQGLFQEPLPEPAYDFGAEVVSTDVSQTWRSP